MWQILTILLLATTFPAFSQIDSAFIFDTLNLNKKDDKGRVHGFWVKYLDAELKPVKKEKGYFYGYEIYDHGTKGTEVLLPSFQKAVYPEV